MEVFIYIIISLDEAWTLDKFVTATIISTEHFFSSNVPRSYRTLNPTSLKTNTLPRNAWFMEQINERFVCWSFRLFNAAQRIVELIPFMNVDPVRFVSCNVVTSKAR